MRFFGDDEERKAYIEKQIDMMRRAAATMPLLRKSLTKFDGKVYNKRFIESFDTDADKLIIRAEKRSYNDSDYVDLYATIDRQYSRYFHICRIVLTNKRISAEQGIQSASECRAQLLKDAANIEMYLERIDEIKAHLDYLEAQRKAIVKDIPYQIKDVYRIDR